MQLPSIHNLRIATGGVGTDSVPLPLSQLARVLRAIAFWSAIALPFLYIPLLLSGLNTNSQIIAFLVLISLNIVALIAGHRYNR